MGIEPTSEAWEVRGAKRKTSKTLVRPNVLDREDVKLLQCAMKYLNGEVKTPKQYPFTFKLKFKAEDKTSG